jgi:hypothetical protein
MTILPLALRRRRRRLLLLDVRHEVRDGLLHHARALHHLRQEHLAGAEQVADDVHAVHQRPSITSIGRAILQPRLLGVGDDEVGDALDQRVLSRSSTGSSRHARSSSSCLARCPCTAPAISSSRSVASGGG